MSKIIESLRGDLAALHEAGAIGKVTMREFDAICPPPVREFSAADIKRLREALGDAAVMVETVRGAGYRFTAQPAAALSATART